MHAQVEVLDALAYEPHDQAVHHEFDGLDGRNGTRGRSRPAPHAAAGSRDHLPIAPARLVHEPHEKHGGQRERGRLGRGERGHTPAMPNSAASTAANASMAEDRARWR